MSYAQQPRNARGRFGSRDPSASPAPAADDRLRDDWGRFVAGPSVLGADIADDAIHPDDRQHPDAPSVIAYLCSVRDQSEALQGLYDEQKGIRLGLQMATAVLADLVAWPFIRVQLPATVSFGDIFLHAGRLSADVWNALSQPPSSKQTFTRQLAHADSAIAKVRIVPLCSRSRIPPV